MKLLSVTIRKGYKTRHLWAGTCEESYARIIKNLVPIGWEVVT